ncbi:MAG: MiaB/RimO family radical SAM methylthiotransferase [Lachnospiraceae bacterium]|nr:MiaB/RimO family radical SAM methylthiotransferase [Lachnospiraceae bacterium]
MQEKGKVYPILQSKKVAIINLGCKVNKYESDAMIEKLQSAGMLIVEPEEYADVYIVNTCSVTNMAQRKSRQMLRRAKKRNLKAVIIAAGCYVNAEHDELLQEDFIDVLVGNNRKNEIVQVVAEYMEQLDDKSFLEKEHGDYYLDINKTKDYEEMGCLNVDVMNHQRAYIKVQDGCNQFCSYCIIPYTRGRVRSRRPENILAEIEQLAMDGIKEFVLTGIHISSYGVDFADKDIEYDQVIDEKITSDNSEQDTRYVKNLGELIYAIEQLPQVERIRLGSLEPRIITKDFLEMIGRSDKLCPHFHLSLQSACNETLKRMNRKYTIEEFMEKCELLREFFDRPAITTDVIVGFPGETEDEFRVTVENLERLNLYELHVFKYSVRSGTVAEKMPNQVPENIKNERSDVLLAMTKKQKQQYEDSLKGMKAEVLIEEMTKDGLYTGHTKRYVKVNVSSDEDIVNQVVCVKL